MYKQNEIVDTVRGKAVIIATRSEGHTIKGSHPFVMSGKTLFPSEGKDYVISFSNPDNGSELKQIYENLTENELSQIIIKNKNN